MLLLAVAMLLSSCASHPDVPSSSKDAKCLPAIYPDYCNVTVPCNIAPLNFMLPADEYEECVTRITTPDGHQQTYGQGVKVQIPESEWHTMLDASKSKSIKVEVWNENTHIETVYSRKAKDLDKYITLEKQYIAKKQANAQRRNEQRRRKNHATHCDGSPECL